MFFMDASFCCTFQALAKMSFPPCAGITFLMGVITAELQRCGSFDGTFKNALPACFTFWISMFHMSFGFLIGMCFLDVPE
jgi:hypothetical protein